MLLINVKWYLGGSVLFANMAIDFKDASNILLIYKFFRNMPIPASHGGQGPSCFDRVKMGFMMGMCVGMASGAIFGGFNCLRFGLRGRELVSNVGKVMIQGGGTFGTFMSIGTGIRC